MGPASDQSAVQRVLAAVRSSALLDDDRKKLHLKDAQGSTLEMAGDAVLLSAKTDLTIEAPGRKIVIRSSSVDFETG